MRFSGLETTGREMRDPTGSLVELMSKDGVHHMAIMFDEAYHKHHCLTGSVALVESFLQFPMVVGLAELSQWDKRKGAFVYPTGQVWTLAEVLRTARDKRKPLGVRAGLELAVLAGQILTEAHDVGRCQGCYAHGNVSPWRVAMKSDGQVLVIGQGLPQMDWRLHLEDSAHPAIVDAVRYAPPERLEGQTEDLSADIYALTVVVYEVMTGEALFPETRLPELRKAITMGEAAARLDAKKRLIPKDIRAILTRALTYDPDNRIDGEAYVEGLRATLADSTVKGASLETWIPELIQQTQSNRQRSRKLVASDEATAARQRTVDDSVERAAIAKPVATTNRARKRGDAKSDTTVFEINAKPARQKSDTPAKSKTSRRKRRKAVEAELLAEAEANGTTGFELDENGVPIDVTVARRRKPPEVAEAAKASTGTPQAKPKTKAKAKASTRKRRRNAPEAVEQTVTPTEEPAKPATKRQRRRTATAKAPEAVQNVAPVQATDVTPTTADGLDEGNAGSSAPAEVAVSTQNVESSADAPQETTQARRRRRRKDVSEPTSEASAPPADTTEARRRRRRTEPGADGPQESPTAARRRRRRGAATNESTEETAEQSLDAAPAGDNTTMRRRRRRSASEDSESQPDGDTTQARRRRRSAQKTEGADDSTQARRRRRGAKTTADQPADDSTTARRRRRSSTAEASATDDSTQARRRRRRKSETDSDSGDDSTKARRRRRSAKTDDAKD